MADGTMKCFYGDVVSNKGYVPCKCRYLEQDPDNYNRLLHIEQTAGLRSWARHAGEGI
jgi:hypothetical protein